MIDYIWFRNSYILYNIGYKWIDIGHSAHAHELLKTFYIGDLER